MKRTHLLEKEMTQTKSLEYKLKSD